MVILELLLFANDTAGDGDVDIVLVVVVIVEAIDVADVVLAVSIDEMDTKSPLLNSAS